MEHTIKISLSLTDQELVVICDSLGYKAVIGTQVIPGVKPTDAPTVIDIPNPVSKIDFVTNELVALVKNRATDIFVAKNQAILQKELEDKARMYKVATEASVESKITIE